MLSTYPLRMVVQLILASLWKNKKQHGAEVAAVQSAAQKVNGHAIKISQILRAVPPLFSEILTKKIIAYKTRNTHKCFAIAYCVNIRKMKKKNKTAVKQ